jgi:hypothetical protein
VVKVLLLALLLSGCVRVTRVEYDSLGDRADAVAGTRAKPTDWLWLDVTAGERLERGEDKPIVGSAVSLRAPGTEVRVSGTTTLEGDATLQACIEVEW